VEGKKKRVFLVNDIESLLTVINLGCIPMHVLAKREFTLDQCDWCTIDFDVQLSTFANGVTIALALKEMLDRIGIPGYPKTSGQTGLHVLFPMGPGVGFETAQMLTVLLGKILAQHFPEIGTMERADVKRRGDRVYIDVFQTHDRKTIVAPYSVRAYKGARVSTPITWAELAAGIDPGDFTIKTVPERVEKLGDPMRKMLEDKPDIPSAVAKLGKLVKDLGVEIG
jgi:bifunctional non-homologous end joining protein LigD